MDRSPFDDTDDEAVRQERMRILGQMLVGIAHELTTPLGAVVSVCDAMQRCRIKARAILDRPDLTPDDLVDLRAILAHLDSGQPVLDVGLERMQALVRELRLHGRSEVDDPPQPVSLVEQIEGSLLLLQYKLKQGITVERRFEAEPMVLGRRTALGQVILNLLHNAVQAIGDRGTITLTVTAGDGVARLDVADDGPGIDPDVLARLFACPTTTKGPDEGTGIGLFYCRKTMAKVGGTVEAANGPAGGAVLTVTMPLA